MRLDRSKKEVSKQEPETVRFKVGELPLSLSTMLVTLDTLTLLNLT